LVIELYKKSKPGLKKFRATIDDYGLSLHHAADGKAAAPSRLPPFYFVKGLKPSLSSSNTENRNRMMLDEAISHVMMIYSRMDDEIARFQAVTGLRCPPG
jgi:hypothetical protein